MPMTILITSFGNQLFWIAYSNRITSETRLIQDKLNHIILSARGDMYGENVLLNIATQPFYQLQTWAIWSSVGVHYLVHTQYIHISLLVT
jgi:hypothetical protein